MQWPGETSTIRRQSAGQMIAMVGGVAEFLGFWLACHQFKPIQGPAS
jgi:hypothetical protein